MRVSKAVHYYEFRVYTCKAYMWEYPARFLNIVDITNVYGGLTISCQHNYLQISSFMILSPKIAIVAILYNKLFHIGPLDTRVSFKTFLHGCVYSHGPSVVSHSEVLGFN